MAGNRYIDARTKAGEPAFIPADKPFLGGRSVGANWIYNRMGGGKELSLPAPDTWPEGERDIYLENISNPTIDDAAARLNSPYSFINAAAGQGDMTPQEWQRAHDNASGIAAPDTDKSHGRFGEYRVKGPAGQTEANAMQIAKLKQVEMRARGVRDLSTAAQYALLSGLLYGGMRGIPKLFMEKDLEKRSAVKSAKNIAEPESPWQAKTLGYEGDLSFLMPAVGITAGLGGYELMDWLTDKARKKSLENKRRQAMTEFQQLFSKGMTQPKLAGLVDGLAQVASGDMEKDAFLGQLPPAAKAILFGTPIGLSVIAYLAARDQALKESKKEKSTIEATMAEAQMRKPLQFNFVPGRMGDSAKQQGPMSNRYEVPVGLPPAGAAQERYPDELDLSKLASLIKSAGQDWGVPTNTPMQTGMQGFTGSSEDPMTWGKPKIPAQVGGAAQGPVDVPGTPTPGVGTPSMQTPGTPGTTNKPLWKTPVGAAGRAVGGAAYGLVDRTARTMQKGVQGVNAVKGMANDAWDFYDKGIVPEKMQTGFDNAARSATTAARDQFNQENPALAAVLGGANKVHGAATGGWSGLGDLIGKLVPGTHPGARGVWDAVPSQLRSFIDSLLAMFQNPENVAQGAQGAAAPALPPMQPGAGNALVTR